MKRNRKCIPLIPMFTLRYVRYSLPSMPTMPTWCKFHLALFGLTAILFAVNIVKSTSA